MRKPTSWLMAGTLTVLAVIVMAAWTDTTYVSPNPGMDGQSLSELKTRVEIRKLQVEADKLAGDNGWPNRLAAGWVVPLVGLITVLSGIYAASRDRDRQRAQDTQGREDARNKRYDERLDAIVAGLASNEDGRRRAAAIQILAVSGPDYSSTRPHLAQLLANTLKDANPERQKTRVDQTILSIGRALASIYRQQPVGEDGAREPLPDVDLTYVQAPRARLKECNLTGTDIAFGDFSLGLLSGAILVRSRAYETALEEADLQEADLTDARWHEVEARGALFRGAKMERARLTGSDLRDTQFQGARLKDASFRGSNLCGARFDRANLINVSFEGAEFDQETITGLRHARHLDRAHLTEEQRAQLA